MSWRAAKNSSARLSEIMPGRFINSPNKKSIVRTAIKQKPDRFEKIAEGRYRVIGEEGAE